MRNTYECADDAEEACPASVIVGTNIPVTTMMTFNLVNIESYSILFYFTCQYFPRFSQNEQEDCAFSPILNLVKSACKSLLTDFVSTLKFGVLDSEHFHSFSHTLFYVLFLSSQARREHSAIGRPRGGCSC